MASNTFEWAVGDTLPEITCTWTGQNITSYTFRLLLRKGGTTSEIAGSIVTAGSGIFKFVPDPEIAAGLYEARIEATNAGGGVQSWSGFYVRVHPEW